MAVADVCLIQDPFGNQAVPTNRFKKLWAIVKEGAPWNQRYFQIVRNRLHSMGVVKIIDRNHRQGKAWKWDTGPNFPKSGSWKEAHSQLDEEHRLPAGLTPNFEKLSANIIVDKKHNLPNTLYHVMGRFHKSKGHQLFARPPPDQDEIQPDK